MEFCLKIFIGKHAQQTSMENGKRDRRRPGKGETQEGPPNRVNPGITSTGACWGQEWLTAPGWRKAAGVFAAFQPFTS